LKPGSFEERSGRQALARLLRSSQPLSRIVRYMLANLVDPEAGDTRAILLMRRTRARLPASIRDHDIAYFIAWRVENGTAMKVAKLDAQDYAKERFNKKDLCHHRKPGVEQARQGHEGPGEAHSGRSQEGVHSSHLKLVSFVRLTDENQDFWQRTECSFICFSASMQRGSICKTALNLGSARRSST
jgi:hypothetical protein